jgi:hypothetical protein
VPCWVVLLLARQDSRPRRWAPGRWASEVRTAAARRHARSPAKGGADGRSKVEEHQRPTHDARVGRTVESERERAWPEPVLLRAGKWRADCRSCVLAET